MENNAQLQKLYLSLSQKQVLFFIYTEIFYGSALLTLKTYALYPLGKNTEDLKLTDAWTKGGKHAISFLEPFIFRFVFL